MENYGGSLWETLHSVYPEYDWHPWPFHPINPIDYFGDSISNRKQLFDWIATEYSINRERDWFQENTYCILEETGAISAIVDKYYNGSIQETLDALYHDYYPQQPSHQRELFAARLSKSLGIKKLEDWYQVQLTELYEKVTEEELLLFGGGVGQVQLLNDLLDEYYDPEIPRLGSCLTVLYPEYEFLPWMFQSGKRY